MSAPHGTTNSTLNNNTDNDNQQHFDNPQDEIKCLRQKLDKNQSEFLEFQESSRELEIEYETQLKHLEKKNNNLILQLSHFEDENDQLKTKYNSYVNDTQYKLNEYQLQVGELTALNDRLTSYIRELEQSNDDLERARRALAASLEDFEAQLNQQIERNVLLENEISEKEELECVVQRLKEEARDLRHELIVNKNNNKNDSARRKQLLMENDAQRDSSLQSISPRINSVADTTTNTIDSNGTTAATNSTVNLQSTSGSSASPDAKDPSLQINNANTSTPSKSLIDSTTNAMTPPSYSSNFRFSFLSSSSSSKTTDTKSQQTSTPSSPTMPSIVLTPSSRISALNIVSDLLRKVGALESKLATAKKVTS